MLKGMIWRKLEGGNWYTEGGYFWRSGEVVWWVVPLSSPRAVARSHRAAPLAGRASSPPELQSRGS